jgi:hypothetical protein
MSTGSVLDLRTGEVRPRSTMDFLDEGGDDIDAPDFEDLERFLWVRRGFPRRLPGHGGVHRHRG